MSTKSVKVSVEHLYAGVNGATVPKCTAKRFRLMTWVWPGLRNFVTYKTAHASPFYLRADCW